MDHSQFETIVENRLAQIRRLLISKGKEYATDKNRLHNFYRAAALSGQSPERCLHGFLLKHLVSYFDMLDEIEKGNYPTSDKLDEKIGDIITYFCLQEALIIDRSPNFHGPDMSKYRTKETISKNPER